MGYYTSYTLTAKYFTTGDEVDLSELFLPKEEVVTEVCSTCHQPHKTMVEQQKYEFINYAIDENGATYDSVKWYNHDEDMIKLSLEFPEIVFTLHGEGEETDDRWKKYYLNGKMQEARAKITVVYDEFDKKKLVNPKNIKG